MAIELSYNNLSNPQNTVVFAGFPQILKITDLKGDGYYSGLTLIINNDISNIQNDSEYSFTFNGETIYSTHNLEEATGNNFYITNINTNANRLLIANSICNALRSLSSLPINYDIFLERNEIGQISPRVQIIAKEIGQEYDIEHTYTMTGTPFLTQAIQNGYNPSIFKNDGNTKICIDVYSRPTLIDTDEVMSNANYVTTLTKVWYGDIMYFDLQPLFTSLAEDGEALRVDLTVYCLADNNIQTLVTYKEIFVANGYSINQGLPFIKIDNLYFAANVSRGMNKGFYNNTVLYTYLPQLNFSLYSTSKQEETTYKIEYLNSAYEVFQTENKTQELDKNITNVEAQLSTEAFSKAYYIDVTLDNIGTIRYNVIKPIKATNEEQRVFWYNSYGGISFIDFTGNRSEVRKTKVEYYQKQLFDYYDTDGTTPLNNVYEKDITITVTLSTHNIEKDATWLLFDLQNSKTAWTYINNKKYFITITDLKITESQVKDIFVGQVEYEMATNDTF